MKTILKVSVLALIIAQMVSAEIILSEILANEPSNRVLLEWFELYNDSDTAVDLQNYTITENGSVLDISEGTIVDPNSYVVLCRRLEPVDDGDCFEYHWGDSSGTWGDSPEESYRIYEVSMSLSNSNGSIYIYRPDSVGVDHYIWDESTDDGRSLERDNIYNPFSGWHECYDQSGSTPGADNSVEPSDEARYYITVEPQAISLSRHENVINIIYGAPSGTEISLLLYDDSSMRRRVVVENSANAVDAVAWDLLDDNGDVVPPGLYFILFRTSGAISVQKSIPVVVAP